MGWDEYLVTNLIGPDGTRVFLFSNVGGLDRDFTNTVLDDSAAISITEGSAPFTGTYRPESPLSAFNTKQPEGFWKLEVENTSYHIGATITSWSLTLIKTTRLVE